MNANARAAAFLPLDAEALPLTPAASHTDTEVIGLLARHTYEQVQALTGWSRGRIYRLALATGARKHEARILQRQSERRRQQEAFLREMVNCTAKADVLDFLADIPDDSVAVHVTICPYNIGKAYGGGPAADTMRFTYFHGWRSSLWRSRSAPCCSTRPRANLCATPSWAVVPPPSPPSRRAGRSLVPTCSTRACAHGGLVARGPTRIRYSPVSPTRALQCGRLRRGALSMLLGTSPPPPMRRCALTCSVDIFPRPQSCKRSECAKMSAVSNLTGVRGQLPPPALAGTVNPEPITITSSRSWSDGMSATGAPDRVAVRSYFGDQL